MNFLNFHTTGSATASPIADAESTNGNKFRDQAHQRVVFVFNCMDLICPIFNNERKIDLFLFSFHSIVFRFSVICTHLVHFNVLYTAGFMHAPPMVGLV